MKNQFLTLLVVTTLFVGCKKEETKVADSAGTIVLGTLSESFTICHDQEFNYVAAFEKEEDFKTIDPPRDSTIVISSREDFIKHYNQMTFYIPEESCEEYSNLGEAPEYEIKSKGYFAFMNINGEDVKFRLKKGELPQAELIKNPTIGELTSVEGRFNLITTFTEDSLKVEIEDVVTKSKMTKTYVSVIVHD